MPKIETICESCGKVFLSYKSQKRKFCSISCKNKCDKRTIICEYCGRKTELKKCEIRVREKRYKIRFCSVDCFRKSIAPKEMPCNNCSKMFLPERTSRKFCSKQCANEARIGVKRGDGFWYEKGYKMIYTSDGDGVKEHILIMEKKNR